MPLTHLQFLRKIHASFGADLLVAQGIYADWLEEQGDPRAEVLRRAVDIQSTLPEEVYFQDQRLYELATQRGPGDHSIWRERACVPRILIHPQEGFAWHARARLTWFS